ncbi:phage tail tape measure protein [Orenia marismortui]|uniref:phage tail tape measure protein n=1 Tax=Orenia marismortui TaxID=46469 RepID=UPI00037D35E4|nr:phage tail tape measure protein [Orenia marismortui]
MATVRSLNFSIGWNVDNRGLDSANQATDRFRNRTEQIDTALQENKHKLLGFTAAAAGGLGFAVKQAADFESQMTRVGQVSGANAKQLELLEKNAKQLGIATAFSAKEAAEGQEYLAMAGFSVRENITALPDVLNLASAAQMDLGRTSDIASDILTGFGLKAEDMTRVVDTLQATSSGANTNVSMLGESMKYLGPTAQNLGYDIETMSAAVGMLANVGIKGGQAGQYLRGALNKLSAPTKEGAEVLDELGINLTDSQGNMLGFVDIVSQFQTSMKGMGNASKQAALSNIFGQEAASAMVAIINQGTDELQGFRTELYSSAGITEKMAKEQMNTLTGAFDQLKGSLNVAAIGFGSELAPAINFVAKGITTLVNGFNKLPAPVQSTIAITAGATTVLLGLATTAGFLIGPLTTAATALGIYTPAAMAAEGATVGFNTALLTNPITGIVVGVVALGAALYGIVTHWDTVKEKTLGFFGWFKGKLEATPDWIQLLIAPITLIPEYWNEIKVGAGQFFGWFKTTLDKTPSWLLAFTAPILLIPRHWDTIKSSTVSTFNAIGSGFSWLGDKTIAFGNYLWGLANKVPDLPGIFNAMKDPIDSVGVKVQNLFANIPSFPDLVGMAKSKFTEFIGFIQENPLTVVKFVIPGLNLIEPINWAYAKARDWLAEKTGLELPEFKIPSITDVFNSIKEKIRWLEDKLSNFDIGSSIRNGIDKTKDTAIGAVAGLTQKVRNYLPFSPAKEGPLSDLDKTGPGFVNTIASGIDKTKNRISDTISNMWTNVKDVSPVRFSPFGLIPNHNRSLQENPSNDNRVINETNQSINESNTQKRTVIQFNEGAIQIEVSGENSQDIVKILREEFKTIILEAAASAGVN